jgi:hypothetical protein
MTQIPTDEGKLYLASVLDLCGRRLLACPMSDHPDAELASDAIKMARLAVVVAPADERANAVAVALDGLGRFAFRAQRQLPRRQQCGEVQRRGALRRAMPIS